MKTITGFTISIVGVLSSVALFTAGQVSFASATADSTEVTAFLERFYQNPVAAMDERLIKRDSENKAVPVETLFTAEEIRTKSFIERRDKVRKEFCIRNSGSPDCINTTDSFHLFSKYQINDLAENLIDDPGAMVRSLEEMTNANLESAKLSERPWSGSYWPMFQGTIASRYSDSSFPKKRDWLQNYRYIVDHPAQPILDQRKASKIDQLSPAEKYEAITGDRSHEFSKYFWEEGRVQFEKYKQIEPWMGICNGWATASYMTKKPEHVVTVMSADGRTPINFYPSDTQALASALWANASPRMNYIGGRCDLKNPYRDPNGRIVDQNCFDTNPGTWHLSAVNQIGVFKRAFVLDATWDYEVWNQPAYGYSYTYFNPQTGQTSRDIQGAKVPMSEFSRDKFRRFRSSEAVAVVGISMDFTYVLESKPRHDKKDSDSGPAPMRTVKYIYDLEINSSGKIIGGEWYTVMHPDFLWGAPKGSRAESIADFGVPESDQWTKNATLPESWKRAAPSGARQGQPLKKVVDRLIDWSQTAK